MICKIRYHNGGKKTYWCDGQEVLQEEFHQAVHQGQVRSGEDGPGSGPCGSSLVGFKPVHSDSLGVHPRQIKEATESAAKKGVPTEFDSKGRPIFTSRLHRKQYCQAYGFFDRDGGYGDAQRSTSRTKGPDESEVRKHYNDLLEASQGPERGNVVEAVRAAMKRHGL